AAAPQLAPYGVGLLAGSYENGNIGRPQALQRFPLAGKARLLVVEPGDDLLGAARCKKPSVVGCVAQGEVMVDRQGRGLAARCLEMLGPTFCMHRLERQGVVVRLAKQEGPRPATRLGLVEPLIDRLDKRSGGAVVRVEHVVPFS